MKHWAVYLLFQPVCLLTALSVVLSWTLFQTNWIYILQFCTYNNFTHRMISLEFQERFLHKNEIPEYASCNPWKSKIKPDLKLADLPFKAASPCTSRLLLDLLEVLEVIFWPTALTSYSGRKQNWNGFCVKLKFKISWWGYSVVMTAGLSLWPNSSFKWKNLRFTLLNGAQSGQKCAFHLGFFFFLTFIDCKLISQDQTISIEFYLTYWSVWMTAFTEQPEFVECAIVHGCLLGHINTIITLLMSFVSLWFYPLPLNTIKVERSENGQNGTSTECSQKK